MWRSLASQGVLEDDVGVALARGLIDLHRLHQEAELAVALRPAHLRAALGLPTLRHVLRTAELQQVAVRPVPGNVRHARKVVHRREAEELDITLVQLQVPLAQGEGRGRLFRGSQPGHHGTQVSARPEELAVREHLRSPVLLLSREQVLHRCVHVVLQGGADPLLEQTRPFRRRLHDADAHLVELVVVLPSPPQGSGVVLRRIHVALLLQEPHRGFVAGVRQPGGEGVLVEAAHHGAIPRLLAAPLLKVFNL